MTFPKLEEVSSLHTYDGFVTKVESFTPLSPIKPSLRSSCPRDGGSCTKDLCLEAPEDSYRKEKKIITPYRKKGDNSM